MAPLELCRYSMSSHKDYSVTRRNIGGRRLSDADKTNATALRTHLLISINPTVGRNFPLPLSYSSISSQSRPVS
jgi:hypothetical protein